jgi:hypothetical protein
MISLWALLSEADVEAYATTLVLPDYLAHLRLGPFRFDEQPESCDGQEPLRLTYCGDGRLEEYFLRPEDHALAMIRFVCSRIATSRLRLPQDDAKWHWNPVADPPEPMRVYFEPATRSLCASAPSLPSSAAYVSVSRRQVFVGRSVAESYLRAWLETLAIDAAEIRFEFETPSGGVEFSTGAVGGQMFLADEVVANDLIRFAGLERALAQVSDWVRLDLDSDVQDKCGVHDEGVYIRLSGRGT